MPEPIQAWREMFGRIGRDEHGNQLRAATTEYRVVNAARSYIGGPGSLDWCRKWVAAHPGGGLLVESREVTPWTPVEGADHD